MQLREPFGSDLYRTIDESRILAFLLSPYELASGNREQDELQARVALDRCIALGLRYRHGPDASRLFDPAEVINFIKFAYAKWGEPIWHDRLVGVLRRMMSEAVPGTPVFQPPCLASLRPERYSVTIARSFKLENHQAGERVRLRLPLPIEDETLRDVEIAFLPPVDVAVSTRRAPARLDVSLEVPAHKRLTLGVKAVFTAFPRQGQVAELGPSDTALYTRGSEGLIRINERVRDIAFQVGGAGFDRDTIVRNFWNYMLDELGLGFIHYDLLDPQSPLDWMLDHGLYDCKIGSALMVALCRARGIPARLVSGYTLNPIEPTMHTWFEVWSDERGWAPFDLYVADLCGGDRDSEWRNHYFGQVDHRMATERPPHLFNGAGAVRLPEAWQMVTYPNPPGTIVTFEELTTGALIYSDQITVERLADYTAPG